MGMIIKRHRFWRDEDDDKVSVVNGIGFEIIVNGTFDIDAAWTKEEGWSISEGKAVCSTGISVALRQSITLEPGSTYTLIGDFTRESGDFIFFLGPDQDTRHISSGWISTGSGAHLSITGVAQANTTNVYVYSGGDGFNGTFDNISIKKVK